MHKEEKILGTKAIKGFGKKINFPDDSETGAEDLETWKLGNKETN